MIVRAAAVDGGTVGARIDANSNLTGDGTRTFQCNARNELVRVEANGVEVASFVYDSLGRRVQKVAGGVTHTYVYDGDDIIEERAGTEVTRYVHGPGIDNVLARTTNGSDPRFYLADHLGSVVQETNGAGVVTLVREYDPWGIPLQAAETSGYAFTGREWDSELGVYYYRARYYGPRTGRFLGADPGGFIDGPNEYGYVSNGPLGKRDPSGQFALLVAALPPLATALEAAAAAAATLLAAKISKDAVDAILRAKNEKDAKSQAELEKHLQKRDEALDELWQLEKDLDKATGPKARDPIQRKIDELKKDIEGHEKEIRQKWPNCKLR